MRTAVAAAAGHDISAARTLEEALNLAKANFTASARDCWFMGNDGEQIPVPEKKVIVRDDNDTPLSVMGDSYSIMQYETQFSIAQALVDECGATYKYGGVLRGGRRMYLQLEVGSGFHLNGNPDEEHKSYVMFMGSHDGSWTSTLLATTLRLFCLNQLPAIKRDTNKSGMIQKVYHRKGALGKMQEASRILNMSLEASTAYQKVLGDLMAKEASDDYVRDFIATIVPSEEEGEEVATRTANRREELAGLFKNGTGCFGKTRYDLLNAVTEYVDHVQGGRVTQKRLSNTAAMVDIASEQRFERAVFGAGARLKEHAFDLLTA